jgi:hypothetical protein
VCCQESEWAKYEKAAFKRPLNPQPAGCPAVKPYYFLVMIGPRVSREGNYAEKLLNHSKISPKKFGEIPREHAELNTRII